METTKREAGQDIDSETARIEHLKLIQAVVDRLARNSFAIKSTAAAASAALVAVAASINSPFAALGGYAVLSLWLLDARFLRQERDFRRLYDSVRRGTPARPGSDDYFTMELAPDARRSDGLLKVVVSLSLFLFYATLMILIGVSAWIASL